MSANAPRKRARWRACCLVSALPSTCAAIACVAHSASDGCGRAGSTTSPSSMRSHAHAGALSRVPKSTPACAFASAGVSSERASSSRTSSPVSPSRSTCVPSSSSVSAPDQPRPHACAGGMRCRFVGLACDQIGRSRSSSAPPNCAPSRLAHSATRRSLSQSRVRSASCGHSPSAVPNASSPSAAPGCSAARWSSIAGSSRMCLVSTWRACDVSNPRRVSATSRRAPQPRKTDAACATHTSGLTSFSTW
mmetsp:Transcript_17903/g.46296  ORF Transcript_17903/g.46296 Transcript_17903/m.46296 type:complete len:249 (-) Transcript_17903:141-887(-)